MDFIKQRNKKATLDERQGTPWAGRQYESIILVLKHSKLALHYIAYTQFIMPLVIQLTKLKLKLNYLIDN